MLGELWSEKSGLFVRAGSAFYRVRATQLPRRAREYDTVEFRAAAGTVTSIERWQPAPTVSWPSGCRPARGVRVGRVTSYDHGSGWIDDTFPFAHGAVKALGEGEAQAGELVEFSMDDDGAVSRVSGRFDTHVSQVGKRLRPATSES